MGPPMRPVLLLLSVLLGVGWASPAAAVETVRIAVAEGIPFVDVKGEGLALGPRGDDDDHFKPLGKSQLRVSLRKGKLFLGDAPAPASGIRLRAKGLLEARGFRMRGTIDLEVAGQGLLLINAIPLEDYLAAVLGGEMPAQFPLEALKAQAVAARTYALQRKIDQYGKAYHLGATVLSQVYGGAGREDPRTKEAVEATRGLVLTWELAPIEAYFHASCGGRTETGKAALQRDLPYLQAVDCPCASEPRTRWSLDVPGALPKGIDLSPGKLSVDQKTGTGRALRLGDGSRSLDGVTFRRLLGYDRLKSLTFEIERDDDGLHLRGRGMGHGAGLCQYGAKALAEDGWGYERILGHYYPGTELQRMY